MSATSQPLALAASATGAITVVVLIVIGVVAVLTLTLIDRRRWDPWAREHHLQRAGTADSTPWGQPFHDAHQPAAGFETPFSGTIRGVPVLFGHYWHALDYTAEGNVKGKLRLQVCVLDLGRPLGRLHLRNRSNPGPLRDTAEAEGPTIGHAAFDRRYVVTVDDSRLRLHLLTPAVVDFLATAPDVAAIRVVGHELVLVGTETRERREHLDTLHHLADGLLARLPADLVRGRGQGATWAR